jgi:ElaB/YqjD/DUF883 family membrane-anchored ribosome-binding protein
MTMSQIEQLQNELSQATCDLINAVAFASEWQGQAMQLRDRIERALQVLREAVTKSNDAAGFSEGSCEGWEMVDQAIQILESTP